jgi:hypothetical protein
VPQVAPVQTLLVQIRIYVITHFLWKFACNVLLLKSIATMCILNFFKIFSPSTGQEVLHMSFLSRWEPLLLFS